LGVESMGQHPITRKRHMLKNLDVTLQRTQNSVLATQNGSSLGC
jgi:hypothetical protein